MYRASYVSPAALWNNALTELLRGKAYEWMYWSIKQSVQSYEGMWHVAYTSFWEQIQPELTMVVLDFYFEIQFPLQMELYLMQP